MVINRFCLPLLVFFVLSISVLGAAQTNPAQTKPPPSEKGLAEKKSEQQDEFLNLGVEENFQKVERYNTVEQINTFIPPLYQPAFVGHGYVLPPGALRVRVNSSFFNLAPDDFFKAGEDDFVHEHHKVDRTRIDLNLFYGLDRNTTLFLNIPYRTSRSTGSVHPAGVKSMDLFVEGNYQEIGDASLIVKKKWVDQANFYFNFATVTGIKFPTGANDKKFDQPMVVKKPDQSLAPAFGGGPFTRFADDGRLPQALQPGTGGFGYILGFMGTRQLVRPRGAFHAGTVLRFLQGDDGIEPGDEVRFFASFVRPVYKEQTAIDLTINGMKKGKDRYPGTFSHPIPNPDGTLGGMATTPRPSFQGGTVVFLSPSLIWSPQPQVRFTVSPSFRLNKPDLGPWPGFTVQFGVSYTLPIFRRKPKTYY